MKEEREEQKVGVRKVVHRVPSSHCGDRQELDKFPWYQGVAMRGLAKCIWKFVLEEFSDGETPLWKGGLNFGRNGGRTAAGG